MKKFLLTTLLLVTSPLSAMTISEFCKDNAGDDFSFTRQVLLSKYTRGLNCEQGAADLLKKTAIDLSFSELTDIRPLLILKEAKSINLESNKIGNILPIFKLENLERLVIDDNLIREFKNVTHPRLRELSINHQKDGLEVKNLAGLTSLKRLSVQSANITDIAKVGHLPSSLSFLDLTRNSITNVESLVRVSKNMNVRFMPSRKLCQKKNKEAYEIIMQACKNYKPVILDLEG